MRALVVVSAVVLLALAVLWVFQRRLVYLPATGPVAAADTVIPGGRDVRLRTGDGLVLGGWLVPARSPDEGVTVLVANGNGGDRSLRAPLARALADAGLG